MSRFTDLLEDSSAKRTIAVIIKPYNLVTESVETFYLSSNNYISHVEDTPPSVYFDDVLVEIPSYTRSIEDFFTGKTTTDIGTLQVKDQGEYSWADRSKYVFGGYEFEIYLGGSDFKFIEFGLIVKGVMLDIEYTIDKSDRSFFIKLGSRDIFFQQKKIHRNQYDDTTPNTDLVGTDRSRCFGEVYSIVPDLYDEIFLKYRIHDGPIEDITMVFDNHVEVTEEGTAQGATSNTIVLAGEASDVDDYYVDCEIVTTGGTGSGQRALITGYVASTRTATVLAPWIITPDNTTDYYVELWIKELSVGGFRLVAQPTTVTAITCNAKGHSQGGYLSTAPEIIEYIVNETEVVTFKEDTVDNAKSLSSAIVGKYFRNGESVQEALNVFYKTMGMVGGFTSNDEYELIRVSVPSTPIATLEGLDIFSIQREAYKPPVQSISLGYKESGIVVNDPPDNTATADQLKFVQKRFREVIAEGVDGGIYPLSSESYFIETSFVNKSDADTEVARLATLFSYPSDIYTIVTSSNFIDRNLGETITVVYDTEDLRSGKDMVCIGVEPVIASNEVVKCTLVLWSPYVG